MAGLLLRVAAVGFANGMVFVVLNGLLVFASRGLLIFFNPALNGILFPNDGLATVPGSIGRVVSDDDDSTGVAGMGCFASGTNFSSCNNDTTSVVSTSVVSSSFDNFSFTSSSMIDAFLDVTVSFSSLLKPTFFIACAATTVSVGDTTSATILLSLGLTFVTSSVCC